jgi:hypothetical protein
MTRSDAAQEAFLDQRIVAPPATRHQNTFIGVLVPVVQYAADGAA